MITEVVPADRSSSLLSAGTISTQYRWSQKWYRPIPQVHCCRPVPYPHNVNDHKSGIGQLVKFIVVGQYHIHIVWMVTKVVPAEQSPNTVTIENLPKR